MKRYGSLRWILLAAGVIAIIGLTGMNVYSLYALHENTIESNRENKKLQIAEFTDKIRYRFFKSFYGLSSIDIEHAEQTYQNSGRFPQKIRKLLNKAAVDPIYNGVYFIPSGSGTCQKSESLLRYSKSKKELVEAPFSEVVCDGMGIARTQMKSIVREYKYSNKVIFDSHRSLTIALVNHSEHSIFGYFTMPLNQNYLRNEYLPQKLAEKFGTPEQSGVNVWLRDWTTNEIIASSDPSQTYDPEKIQFEQDFPDFFDYWELQVSLTDQSMVAASRASLIKNILVLGAAVILLLGALVFMFRSAQKERALAERQAGFLANVTHELKTPLAVMQAAGENLADGRVSDPDRLKSYGNHIYNETLRLRNMIEKLLDVAKADADKSLINPQALNLAKPVTSYIDEHREYFEKKGFHIHTSINESLPLVMIDPDSFNTILGNIVDNAVKYSNDEKFIDISLYNNNDEVILEISDHGIGMKKEEISQIFDKFYRAEDTLTAKTKGHGLGLSIVKNLVELNGGTIDVSSKPGDGSTFTIKFPILMEDVEEEEVAYSPTLEPNSAT